MQATEAAMVESTAMVRATRPGVVARRAILRELRKRRGVPATVSELATASGVERGSARRHLFTLVDGGLVQTEPGRPLRFSLTAAGILATD